MSVPISTEQVTALITHAHDDGFHFSTELNSVVPALNLHSEPSGAVLSTDDSARDDFSTANGFAWVLLFLFNVTLQYILSQAV